MLRTSGLLPHEVFQPPFLPLAVHHPTLSKVAQQEDVEASQKHQYELDTLQQSDFVDGNGWMKGQKGEELLTGGWTSEMIENERQRGMDTVNVGDLDNLERDFLADVDLLGRHFDL